MGRPTSEKKLRIVLGGLGLIAIAWLVAQVIRPLGVIARANPFRARVPGRPLVIAHRGGSGLNPENTLEAFAASAALGCDALEMDVRLTRDGVLVTHHDATVVRTSNGLGLVVDQTLAELKALNFGAHFRDPSGAQPYCEHPARIATVDELFRLYPNLPMVIELKDRGETGRRAGAALAALITKYRRGDNVVVASFDDATLQRFRELAGPGVRTSAAKEHTRKFALLSLCGLDRLWSGGVDAIQIPCHPREAGGFNLARPLFIRAAHSRNVAVHYWTVNEPGEMRRLIDLGADGLITDHPDRLKALLP